MTQPELHIRKRFKDLLPPLTDQERKQLEANLVKDGRVIDAILYWHDGKENVVVDGMHRLPIANKHGLAYRTEPVELGKTYEEAEEWIWSHQTGRRNMTREAIGKWYNQLKGNRGGDHTSKGTNAPLLDAAKDIGEKVGKDPKTVKRAGARAKDLAKCTTAIQKGVESRKIKATDAEVKTLSGLAPLNQDNIARDIRGGKAKTVTEAMAKRKIKQPAGKKPAKAKPAKKKPPKKLDQAAYYKEWERAIGPVMRTLDKIAGGVDGKDSKPHKAILKHLDACTETMAAWMGLE